LTSTNISLCHLSSSRSSTFQQKHSTANHINCYTYQRYLCHSNPHLSSLLSEALLNLFTYDFAISPRKQSIICSHITNNLNHSFIHFISLIHSPETQKRNQRKNRDIDNGYTWYCVTRITLSSFTVHCNDIVSDSFHLHNNTLHKAPEETTT
jgi:hypothetical protein